MDLTYNYFSVSGPENQAACVEKYKTQHDNVVGLKMLDSDEWENVVYDYFASCAIKPDGSDVKYLASVTPHEGQWILDGTKSTIFYETNFPLGTFDPMFSSAQTIDAVATDFVAKSKALVPSTQAMVKYWFYVYYSNFLKGQSMDSFCKDAYKPENAFKDFVSYPEKDLVSISVNSKTETTAYLNFTVGGTPEKVTLTGASNMAGATFDWKLDGTTVVKFDGQTTDTITGAAAVTIASENYGSASVTVTSSFGGSNVIKVIVQSMPSDILKIKNLCLSEGIAPHTNKCNDINKSTDRAGAEKICIDVFTLSGKMEQGTKCTAVKADSPVTTPGQTGETKEDSQLLKDIKAKLSTIASATQIVSPDKRVSEILGASLKIILGLIGSLALAMFVFSGFKYMTSAGDQKKLTEAKSTIVWAIGGLLAVFASFAVLNFVISKL